MGLVVNAHYHIYIDTQELKHSSLHRLYVECLGEVTWVGAVYDQDCHGKIYQGKVVQTFGNGKAKIQVGSQRFLYCERSFKGEPVNVGDSVWVQAHSISALEMNEKDHKGTLNIALPCGPIVLYPFETGIHISQRLKQYPEFSNSLKHHFEPFAARCGIKFRLSSKDYSFSVLERLVKWVKHIWDTEQYNFTGFRVLNEVLHYFLEPACVYSNDDELTSWLFASIQAIFNITEVAHKRLPLDKEWLEDAWDRACRTSIPLLDDASMIIQETHACTVIDINAGSSSTSFDRINLEAVYVLPKLLSQGKFGGKILVDLLPIKHREESELLLKRFMAEWQGLDVSAQVFGISKMGLLEFIIPRKGVPLWWIDKKINEN